MFRMSLYWFCLIAALHFTGCFLKNGINATADEVERNRRLWQESKIENYDFEIERHAEGMGGDWTLNFNVRNNETLPVKTKNKLDYPPAFQHENINSVRKLFDYVQQQSVKEDQNVSVAFDEKYGFPKQIRITSKKSNGWLSIEVKQFEVVK